MLEGDDFRSSLGPGFCTVSTQTSTSKPFAMVASRVNRRFSYLDFELVGFETSQRFSMISLITKWLDKLLMLLLVRRPLDWAIDDEESRQ